MTEVPFGVLLSGGLDSSLIASIAQKMLNEGKAREWGDKIHTFSVGLEDSPDMKAAAKVAEHLGSIHHGFVFTLQEAEDALEDVIYHLETYDITTIRASTPMFLLSRRIKAMGIKMVLSGEGSDEVFGGYLYFHHAPTTREFQTECGALINRLHYSDCLRANKSTMAWGLEARVPFLDLSFLETSIPVDPQLKIAPRRPGERRIEKYILREAFSKEMSGYEYLPEEFLWRQKEQFSDGVGYGWIDHLKKITSERVTDQEIEGTGMNKEAYYYMEIYKRLFPNRQGIIPRWKPRTDWQGITSDDPSGRAVKVHEKAI
jgi:asparagine synthase (glutamine-hydrolysing)